LLDLQPRELRFGFDLGFCLFTRPLPRVDEGIYVSHKLQHDHAFGDMKGPAGCALELPYAAPGDEEPSFNKLPSGRCHGRSAQSRHRRERRTPAPYSPLTVGHTTKFEGEDKGKQPRRKRQLSVLKDAQDVRRWAEALRIGARKGRQHPGASSVSMPVQPR
jgi:hypothetical protein